MGRNYCDSYFEKQGLRIICPDSLMFAWIVIFLFFKYSRSELR